MFLFRVKKKTPSDLRRPTTSTWATK